MLDPNAIKVDVDIERAKKANLSEMLIALPQTPPLLTSTSYLISNKLFAESTEPPVSYSHLAAQNK